MLEVAIAIERTVGDGQAVKGQFSVLLQQREQSRRFVAEYFQGIGLCERQGEPGWKQRAGFPEEGRTATVLQQQEGEAEVWLKGGEGRVVAAELERVQGATAWESDSERGEEAGGENGGEECVGGPDVQLQG